MSSNMWASPVVRAARSLQIFTSNSIRTLATAAKPNLTEDQKNEIRALRAKDPVGNSQQKLAKQFNVSGLYIAMIARLPGESRKLSAAQAEDRLSQKSARHQIAVLRRRTVHQLARTPGERGL